MVEAIPDQLEVEVLVPNTWGEETARPNAEGRTLGLIEALRDGANVPVQRVEALWRLLRDCSERPYRGRGIDRA